MEKTIASQSYLGLIKWLIDARISRGWSIRDLAAELDVAHTTIHRIETLERRLDVHEYVHYCRALNLDPIEGITLFLLR
ncbi:MAG: helix-turn-helix transcriptional regulator [Cellvibrio sp.]|uniref:helix-turn-helix domain-containing protein n=1 Tax=Cellvibrio sp. TaxID=1965322 RepID=UPI0031A05CAF